MTLNATLATAIQVLTQGAPNLDFKYVSGGSCAAGATYTSGQTCTVDFSFTPTVPGQRLGAVELYDNSATPVVIATILIGGTGTGPLAATNSNPTFAAFATVPGTPTEAAFDGSGNLWVNDNNPGSNGLHKVTPGGVVTNYTYTGANGPFGIAIDGAGFLYISQYSGGTVLRVDPVALTSTVYASGFTQPEGLVFDQAGNLYVADTGANEIYKVTAANTKSVYVTTSSTNNPDQLAIDTAGTLYWTSYNNNVLEKATTSNLTPTLVTSTLTQPFSLQVDAAGHIYVQNESGTTTAVTEYTNAGTQIGSFGIGNQLYGLALDASGNVFVVAYTTNTVYKATRTTATLAFPNTAVGAASVAQNVEFENDGNAALTIASIAPSNSNFTFAGAANAPLAACGSTLALAAQCNVAATFTPKSAGADTGTGVVTENSLNVSGSTQTVALSGTGTQGTKTVTLATLPASPVEGTSATLSAYASDNDPIVFSVTSGTATIGATTSSTTNGVTTYTATITYTNPNSVTIRADSPTTANATDAYASQTITATATATFTAPTTNVGATSATQTAVVTFASSGTLTTISVLTQGAGSKDYNVVSGGTCTTSSSYTANQTCTVLYNFTPSRPGQRIGAVVLSPTSGASLGAALLSGTGTGPLATFPGSTTIATLGSGFSQPAGVAVDGNGDVFVADAASNSVKEIVAGSNGNAPGVVSSTSTVNTINSTFNVPRGVAVDGSGNVFVADTGSNAIKKIAAVKGVVSSTSTVTSVGSNFNGPKGLAVDRSGNVFVADNGHQQVKEIVAVNGVVTSSSTVNVVGSGFTAPNSVAVDVNGNVFVSDGTGGTVDEIVAGTGGAAPGAVSSTSTVNVVGSGFSTPEGVIADASGDVFVGDNNSSTVLEILAVNGIVSSSSTVIAVGSGLSGPHGLALDGSGHLFVADFTHNLVKEVDLTTAPAQTFVTTSVGATSTDSPESVSVQNAGNAALTFNSLTTGTTNFPVSATGTCATGSPLAESAICTVAASFTPQSAGALTGTFTLTDNSLNATSATQSVALSGTGTLQQPTITGISPASGATVGGTTVTITGTNLYGTTSVKFGTTAATSFMVVSNTTITAASPAGSGTVDITVSNGTYTSATGTADQFTYLTAQTITFTQPTTPVFVGTLATLQATGGASGNPVTFSIVSGTATLFGTNNSSIRYTTAGTVVIAANQAGNGTYLAATQVTRTVVVLTQSVFIVNSGGTVTTTVDNSGATAQNTNVSGGGIGAAVDASGSFWSVYASGAGVSKFTDTGALTANYTASNLTSGAALAIDGNGVIWIAQGGSANNIFALTNAGAVLSTTGFAQAAGLSTPSSITVNAAGSLWIANQGSNTVTEVIGVAAPVQTPVVQQVISQNPGTKP